MHTDAAGRETPATDTVQVQWFNDKHFAQVANGGSVILDLERKKIYFIRHASRKYVESPLPYDLTRIVSPALATAMRGRVVNATVKPTGETSTVGSLKCIGYDVAVSTTVALRLPKNAGEMNMTSRVKMKVWATEDHRLGLSGVQGTFGAELVKVSRLMPDDASARELGKIKGFEIASDSTAEVMGSKLHMTMEVVEISERAAPAGVYSVPAGYTRTATLEDLGQAPTGGAPKVDEAGPPIAPDKIVFRHAGTLQALVAAATGGAPKQPAGGAGVSPGKKADQGAATRQARIAFEKTTLDFGQVESDAVVDLEFKFKNTGDDVLIIKNISTSTGALSCTIDKKQYNPGESGVLRGKFYTRGYNGKVSKSITVTTNDMANVYTRLTCAGTPVLLNFAAIEVRPDGVDFGTVALGQKLTRTITLKNTGTTDLRLIEVTHGPEFSSEFPADTVSPGKETAVVIHFKAMQAGRFASFFKIRTNAYKQRLVIVKFSADIKDKP